MNFNDRAGMIVARGLTGEDSEVVDEMNVDNGATSQWSSISKPVYLQQVMSYLQKDERPTSFVALLRRIQPQIVGKLYSSKMTL